MLVPQRNYQSPAYRYGFQGQEKDDEIKGNGNSLNYKFRMHDPRVGRFFAVDPLASKYPWNSSYAFSENRVIDSRELEGLEKTSATTYDIQKGDTFWDLENENDLPHGLLQELNPDVSAGNLQVGQEINFATYIKSDAGSYWIYPNNSNIKEGNISSFERSNDLDYSNQGEMMFAVFFEGTRDIVLLGDAYNTAQIAYLPEALYKGGKAIWSGAEYLLKMVKPGVSGGVKELLKDAAKAENLFIKIADTADEFRYLETMQAEALFVVQEGTTGHILVKPNVATETMVEEIIHFNQFERYGLKYFENNRTLLEIEAQEELLKLGTKEGWSKEVMDELTRAKEAWQTMLEKEVLRNGTTGN